MYKFPKAGHRTLLNYSAESILFADCRKKALEKLQLLTIVLLSAIEKCLEVEGDDFKFDEFLQSLQTIDVDDAINIDKSFIRIGLARFLPVNESELWHGIFHERFGLCLNLNLARSTSLEYVPIDQEDKPILEIVLNPEKIGTTWMFLHTKDDFPDATMIHPLLVIPEEPKIYSLQIKKTISTRFVKFS